MIARSLRAFARERLTVSTTAKKLTRSVYEDDAQVGSPNRRKATAAEVRVLGSGVSIYVTVEGTTPSATAGVTYQSGDTIELQSGEAIRKFQALRTAAADVDIEVTYYSPL